MDNADLLERFIETLERHAVRYCVVGGQAVNAYVEPLVSLDLDLVVATEQIGTLEAVLAASFRLQRFPHSLNISAPDSDLRIQIQTDPRYAACIDRAAPRTILGRHLPVASVEDVLQGKVWAFEDPNRRGSTRRKDLADVACLIDSISRPARPLPFLIGSSEQ